MLRACRISPLEELRPFYFIYLYSESSVRTYNAYSSTDVLTILICDNQDRGKSSREDTAVKVNPSFKNEMYNMSFHRKWSPRNNTASFHESSGKGIGENTKFYAGYPEAQNTKKSLTVLIWIYKQDDGHERWL